MLIIFSATLQNKKDIRAIPELSDNMGIPFYFKSLISKFPDIIHRSLEKCDRLYLDYNCIIHMCAAKLLLCAKNESQQEFHSKVIKDALEYITVITRHMTPTQLLYIAVDGTCPRAKMQQQRKRRFMSIWRSERINEVKGIQEINESVWDSNIVTPGTEFMNTFDIALDAFVKDLALKVPYEVICNGSNSFGEGEHKIFDRITNDLDDQDTVHVVYGLDADLIMLSLIQNCQGNIHLLREVPEFNIPQSKQLGRNMFLQLDISKLKRTLCKECLMDDSTRLYDYIMLCVLVGNDFVPPLSYLKIKNDGIDVLLRIYTKVASNPCMLNKYLVVFSDQTLNTTFLVELMNELAQLEDACMVEADQSYYQRKAYFDRKSIEQSIDNHPCIFKFPKLINVSQPNWRLSYYKYLFNYESKDLVQKACESYLEGVLWVFNYYFTKDYNYGWYYPFSYSPTCLDLYNFMVTAQDSIQNNLKATSQRNESHAEFLDVMRHAHMHLLMVLPPSSSNLIPLPLRSLMKDVSHGCLQYYPIAFDITTYLKTYLWECSPVLPNISIKRLYDAYAQIQAINQKQ